MVDGKPIYIYELDGKHSEAEGYIDVTVWTEKDIQEKYSSIDNDGDELKCTILNIFGLSPSRDADIVKTIERNVQSTICSIDPMVSVTFQVPESKREQFTKIANKLIEELNAE